MSQHALLNSVEHSDLKVITQAGAEYGDNLWFTPTFPQEFRAVSAYYPIFFHKDPATETFHAVALFGFTHNDNLFLDGDRWQAGYIPLSLRRQPFLIGRQRFKEDGMDKEQRVIHIDLAHPRVSRSQGEPLFLPLGGNSDYLDHMAELLETLHLGMEDGQDFVENLKRLALLEVVTLELTLNDGSQHQMVGFYTIDEARLAQLDGEALAELNRRGHLLAIYLAIASQSRMRDLLARKNQRLGL